MNRFDLLMKKFVCLLFLLTGLQFSYALADESQVRIGALLALSGDLAPLGSEVLRGIELALDNSKNAEEIVLVVEDIQSLVPRAAVSAAKKIINIDKVDVAITMIVEEAEPIAPIFTQAKVPLLVVWDSNEALKKAGPWIFSNGFSTERSGRKMARFAAKNLKLARIAVVRHNDSFSDIISDAFSIEFKKQGGKVIVDESFNPSETDYRVTLSKIKALDADSIYLPLIPMNSALFLKQAKQLEVNLPLLSADSLIPEVVKAAGGTAEGIYLTNNFTDEADKLTKLYKAKYSSAPSDVVMVSLGYDGAKQVLKAISKSEGNSIREALEEIYGTGRSADREQRLYQIRKGEYVELEGD